MRILPIIGVLAVIVYIVSLWVQYKKMSQEHFEEPSDYPVVYKNGNERPDYIVPASSPLPTQAVPQLTREPSWVSKIKSGSPSPTLSERKY